MPSAGLKQQRLREKTCSKTMPFKKISFNPRNKKDADLFVYCHFFAERFYEYLKETPADFLLETQQSN